MLTLDRYYELLTAALARDTIPGATVRWDQKIQGRQFDVMVELDAGPHKVLLAMEVKHHRKPTEVSAVEAFVTKGKGIKANKLVFVSSSGFQSGCVPVAASHDVDLMHLTLDPVDSGNLPKGRWLSEQGEIVEAPTVKILADEPGNMFEEVTVHYADGRPMKVPDDPSQMRYYLTHTTIGNLNLLQIIDPASIETLPEGERRLLSFQTEGVITSPDDFFIRSGPVTHLTVEVTGAVLPVVEADFAFEPTVMSPSVNYKDVLTGKTTTRLYSDLPIGPLPFEEGEFYFAYHPLRYVQCALVTDDYVVLHLIESFQNGTLLRSRETVLPELAKFFLPVPKADKKLNFRLKVRAEAFAEKLRGVVGQD